jgi:hypothetical protein
MAGTFTASRAKLQAVAAELNLVRLLRYDAFPV